MTKKIIVQVPPDELASKVNSSKEAEKVEFDECEATDDANTIFRRNQPEKLLKLQIVV
jgi:hypothetical protein